MSNLGDKVVIGISLVVSFIILAGTAMVFLKSLHGKGNVKGRELKKMPPLHILIIGAFLSLLVIFVFYNSINGHNLADAVLVGCFNAVRVFLANEDISFLQELFSSNLPDIAGLCNVYISFLYIFAPVLMLSFVLSYIENVTAGLKFMLLGHRKLYVFSNLNERSILLAEDIKRNAVNKKALVIFSNVFDRNMEKVYEYSRRADAIGAICFKKSIEDLDISAKSRTRKVCLFLLGEDETANLQSGIALIEKYRNKLQVDIYIMSAKTEAEIMLDSIPKGDIPGKEARVRRINEYQNMVYQLLDERPLFLNTREKKISVLIVGVGAVGFEAMKAVSWCGQIEGYQLEIIVADRDPEVENRFAKQCPELVSNKGNAVGNGFINFITVDVRQDEFLKTLEAYKDVNYVIVSLGDEDLNIETAVGIRKFYTNYQLGKRPASIKEVCPLINVLVSNPYRNSIVGALKNVQEVEYNLLPFGDLRLMYKEEAILDSFIERLALNVHYAYGADLKSFDQSEYNRKSSISSAMHLKYKLFLVLGNQAEVDWAGKPSQRVINLYRTKITKEIIEKLSMMEHLRWNAYTRSEGYVYASQEEVGQFYGIVNKHYNVLARKHPCLVDWEELDALSEFVGRLKGKKVDFKEDDRKIVSKLPEIFEKALSTEPPLKVH